MDDYIDPALLEPEEKFAIGQPVPRSEDPVLLRGEGHYADDISLPGQAYAVMVRSHIAHGVIRGIDTAAARTMPGVLAVYTAADLAKGGVGPLPARQVMNNRDGTPMLTPVHYALPSDKVRHVGEAVAAVDCRDRAPRQKTRPRPSQSTSTRCRQSPNRAWPTPPMRRSFTTMCPAMSGSTSISATARKSPPPLPLPRMSRGSICATTASSSMRWSRARPSRDYDRERQHWTLNVGCQGVFGFRNYIAGVFGVGRDKMRILTERVGGSFGMKQPTYSEYYCILHAAREFGRPVKWTDERSGSFVSDSHGRDHDMNAELALDRDGHFLAVRLTGYGNLGATYGAPGPATRNAVRNTLGVYKTPLIEVSTKCVFTNTTPVGAYRGAGRPEANYYMERLVEAAAAEMGIDRVELRRRNHIPPEAMPYKAPNGTTYDSGDFTNLLERGVTTRRLERLCRAPGGKPGPRPDARPRHQRLPRTDRPTRPRDGRYPLRAERRCDDHHRHPRLRPRALVSLCPGAGDEARHSVSPHPAAARRQRRADRRRRHRRLKIDDDQRRGDRRGRRKGRRGGQADRRPCAGGGRRRYRIPRRPICDRWHRPFGRDHGTGGRRSMPVWNCRRACRKAST